jgi:predicted transcriptional regulator
LKDQRIIDNRYLIANLIACEKDTPRVVDPDVFGSVFEVQEKVIEDIITSVERQRALQSAPRSVDPVQQTVATVVQGYLSHPVVERQRAIDVIRALNQPMLAVQVRELRKAYTAFQKSSDIRKLLNGLELSLKDLAERNGDNNSRTSMSLNREDLRLICFEVISG